MSIKIGPTFTEELERAGLLGLSFSWGDDGSVFYAPGALTSEQEGALAAVLDAHDPSSATRAMVKAEAARRIEAAYPLWRQMNIVREGGAALAAMTAMIDAIRAASDAIEALQPIPGNFADESYWA